MEINLYKILSGIIRIQVGNQVYKISPPTAELLYEAHQVGKQAYDEAFSSGVLTFNETIEWMIEEGYWSEEDEKQIGIIQTKLDKMKEDYFDRFDNLTQREFIKKNIQKTEQDLKILTSKKLEYHKNTCEGIQVNTTSLFLLEKSISPTDYSEIGLSNLQMLYQTEILSDEEVRQVAKSNIWRSYWLAKQDGVFGKPAIELTDMQRQLISWTKLYDSAFESPDCPSEEVLNDDYAFDGWLIKRKNDRASKSGISSNEKINNAGEVFINARGTPEEAAKKRAHIDRMNNPEAKAKIQDIKSIKGSIDDKDLRFNRFKKQLMINSGKKR